MYAFFGMKTFDLPKSRAVFYKRFKGAIELGGLIAEATLMLQMLVMCA